MKIIDLTHTVEEEMPVYPGTEQPSLTPAYTLGQNGFSETKISLFSHTGTHIDPPAHIIAGGRTLDSFDASDFVGRGIAVDCREIERGGRISLDLLLGLGEELRQADFILLCTGWDKLWGREEYFRGYPTLSPEALEYIISLPCRGIGLDVMSLDSIENGNISLHKRWLSAREAIIIENLRGLDALIGERFTFCSLPLKLRNSDGAPTRAIAIVE